MRSERSFDKQSRGSGERRHIDRKIDDYIERDGYKALLTALTDDAQRRDSSHHREGLGGAAAATQQDSNGARVQANGELSTCLQRRRGRPGALWTQRDGSDPHRVIEAWLWLPTVGASKAHLWRAEYPWLSRG